MKRGLTPLLRRLHDLASTAGFSHPLGRACAAVNRHYNDGTDKTDDEQIRLMASFRESTALRWLEHYLADGSLKTLRRTRAQESARRRAYEKKLTHLRTMH